MISLEKVENGISFVPMITNSCYGGFGYDTAFIELLGGEEPESRSDQKIFQTMNKYKLEAKDIQGSFAQLVVEYVPKVLIDYCKIKEEDGFETLVVDTDRFLVERLEEYFDGTISEKDLKLNFDFVNSIPNKILEH